MSGVGTAAETPLETIGAFRGLAVLNHCCCLNLLFKSWRNKGGSKLMPEYGFLPVTSGHGRFTILLAAARNLSVGICNSYAPI